MLKGVEDDLNSTTFLKQTYKRYEKNLAFINMYLSHAFLEALGLVDYHNREWIKLKFYSRKHDTIRTQLCPSQPSSPILTLLFETEKPPFSFFEITILPKISVIEAVLFFCGQDDGLGRHCKIAICFYYFYLPEMKSSFSPLKGRCTRKLKFFFFSFLSFFSFLLKSYNGTTVEKQSTDHVVGLYISYIFNCSPE